MTTIKERLKSSQGSGNSIPKLNIAERISLKESESSGPVFAVWDKDAKENKIYPAPISGILIGTAMEATSYSDHLGSKGGNYTSSYYFTNKEQIALFAPTPKGYEVVHRGDMDSLESYIKQHSTGNLKKRQVLFVLNENGLLAIATNLSIAIDQIRQHKEELTERYIHLHPVLFSENDNRISRKAKEYLGKFRTKNPPKFAAITVGELISEEDFQNWNAEAVIEEYNVWKEFKQKGGVEKHEEQQVEKHPQPEDYETAAPAIEPKNDLPF